MEKSEHSKEAVRPRGLYTILTKADKGWRRDKTKEREFGLFGEGKVNCGKVARKCIVRKGWLIWLCRLKSSQVTYFFYKREIYSVLLKRKGEITEFLLCLLFLNCLKLKIILLPKWHILGHIQIPSISHSNVVW